MASIGRLTRFCGTNVINFSRMRNIARLNSARLLSSSTPSGTGPATQDEKDEKNEERTGGWLDRLFVRAIDAGHESHSSQLANKDVVYEMQVHKVKPDCMEAYLKEFHTFIDMVLSWNTGAELLGSWTVEVGDLDEAIHIWKFPGGYPALNNHKSILRTNENFIEFRKKRNMMLKGRTSQILLAFSFWDKIIQRPGNNIYELRTYTLKPGTLIEWGNYWAKGVKHRQVENESVAGFFAHIGELFQCHHLWAYGSLQHRQEVRENAWSRPGWDECVAGTVPLLRHATSRILIPMPFSPLK